MTTETYHIEKDIQVICVTAKSFPDGIQEAFQQLNEVLPEPKDRTNYGLSRPQGAGIVYKAAAAELYPGEAQALNCSSMQIKKGRYISTIIENFMDNPPAIGLAFQKMLENPGILDPEAYCVEIYFNPEQGCRIRDVRCMIRLKDQ
eukprot:gene2710-3129_t